MVECSRSNITSHQFHNDKNEGEIVIGYEIIIMQELMFPPGMISNFKQHILE